MTPPTGFIVTGLGPVRVIWCGSCWQHRTSRFGPVLTIWAHWHVCEVPAPLVRCPVCRDALIIPGSICVNCATSGGAS